MLVALISGPVLHAAMKGRSADVDDAWIDALVGVVLRGAGFRGDRSAAEKAAVARTKRKEAARR